MFPNIRRLDRQRDDTAESGQTLVEYALILMFVALVTVTALEAIGLTVTGFISDAAAGFSGG